MKMDEYVKAAVRTESVPSSGAFIVRLRNNLRILHGAMGACTESAELLDACKKCLFYGKELDSVNIVEELGDVLWYVAIICDCLQVPLEEILRKNVEKLKARFPEKFTEDKALNRDLSAERTILEG